MDELALNFVGVRKGTKQVMTQFLLTELAAAHILCRLAKVSCPPTSAGNRLRMTQLAVDTVRKFMWTVDLDPQQLDQVTAQLEFLRFELGTVQRNLNAADGGVIDVPA